MTHYRIYLLGALGQILTGKDVQCLDDATALTLACSLANPGQQAEVWTGTRSLGRVTAG